MRSLGWLKFWNPALGVKNGGPVSRLSETTTLKRCCPSTGSQSTESRPCGATADGVQDARAPGEDPLRSRQRTAVAKRGPAKHACNYSQQTENFLVPKKKMLAPKKKHRPCVETKQSPTGVTHTASAHGRTQQKALALGCDMSSAEAVNTPAAPAFRSAVEMLWKPEFDSRI